MTFDADLSALAVDLSGFGPDAETLAAAQRERAVRVEGFRLVPTCEEAEEEVTPPAA